MAMKINGIGDSYTVPRVITDYLFKRFDPTMSAIMNGKIKKTVDIKAVLENAWNGVVAKSKQKPCNDYFKTLFRAKSLAEILDEGDIIFHCLEPKSGYSDSVLPEANTAGRDIGINPVLFFDSGPNVLVCALIHELAHVGGASTDRGAVLDKAHAAEKALMSCSCTRQYRKDVLGSIRILKSASGFGRRYA